MRKKILTIDGQKVSFTGSGWFRPYATRNKRPVWSLRLITKPDVPGVYLVRHKKTKEILYVGFSQVNLGKTLYRHFQSWVESRHHHATYSPKGPYQIRVIVDVTPKQAQDIENYLVRRKNPRDNHLRYIGQQNRLDFGAGAAIAAWLDRQFTEEEDLPF